MIARKFLSVCPKDLRKKLRRDPPEDHEFAEESSLQTDENNCISEQDFEYISSKVENKVSKRLRDTEHCQRDILKLILNLSAKVDSLSNSTSLEPNYLSSRTEINGNLQDVSISEHMDIPGPSNEYSNMVTEVSTNQQDNNHQRSSSLSSPNQRYPDDIIDKLLQSLQTATNHNSGVPRLPKAMSTTMPHWTAKQTNSNTSRTSFRQASRCIRTSQKMKKYNISILS